MEDFIVCERCQISIFSKFKYCDRCLLILVSLVDSHPFDDICQLFAVIHYLNDLFHVSAVTLDDFPAVTINELRDSLKGGDSIE